MPTNREEWPQATDRSDMDDLPRDMLGCSAAMPPRSKSKAILTTTPRPIIDPHGSDLTET